MSDPSFKDFIAGLAVSTRRHQPSQRNLEIHFAVRMLGRSQSEVARELGIKQQRVSQIVHAVECWRVQASAVETGEMAGEYRARAEHWIRTQRAEHSYCLAMQNLRESSRTLATHREGQRDGKAWNETVRREQAANPRWLALAMQADDKLDKLAGRPVPPPPADPDRDRVAQTEAALGVFGTLRQEAELLGYVAPCGDPEQFIRELVCRGLGLGEPIVAAAFVPEGLHAIAPAPQAAPVNTAPQTAPVEAAPQAAPVDAAPQAAPVDAAPLTPAPEAAAVPADPVAAAPSAASGTPCGSSAANGAMPEPAKSCAEPCESNQGPAAARSAPVPRAPSRKVPHGQHRPAAQPGQPPPTKPPITVYLQHFPSLCLSTWPGGLP